MLKSWLLLLAAESGNGSPPSGAAAQQAVWPEEPVLQSTVRPVKDPNEDNARKVPATDSGKTTYTFRPERETGYAGGGRTAGWSEDKPSFQAVEVWRVERTEECLV